MTWSSRTRTRTVAGSRGLPAVGLAVHSRLSALIEERPGSPAGVAGPDQFADEVIAAASLQDRTAVASMPRPTKSSARGCASGCGTDAAGSGPINYRERRYPARDVGDRHRLPRRDAYPVHRPCASVDRPEGMRARHARFLRRAATRRRRRPFSGPVGPRPGLPQPGGADAGDDPPRRSAPAAPARWAADYCQACEAPRTGHRPARGKPGATRPRRARCPPDRHARRHLVRQTASWPPCTPCAVTPAKPPGCTPGPSSGPHLQRPATT